MCPVLDNKSILFYSTWFYALYAGLPREQHTLHLMHCEGIASLPT